MNTENNTNTTKEEVTQLLDNAYLASNVELLSSSQGDIVAIQGEDKNGNKVDLLAYLEELKSALIKLSETTEEEPNE